MTFSLTLALTLVVQSSASPPPRGHTAMAYDDGRGAVLLSGGLVFQGAAGEGMTFLDDLWAYDGKSWQSVESRGAKMAGQSLVFDARRKRLLEFGGWLGGSNDSGDLLALEPKAKEWKRVVASPELARADAAIAFDTRRDRLVLFGAGSGHDETWEFDGKAWAKGAAKGPDGKGYVKMVWDAARQRIVLFNGQPESGPPKGGPSEGKADEGEDKAKSFGNTWEYDGAAWKLATSSGPGARTWFGLVYDDKRKRTVMFGGMGREGDPPGTFSKETWAFDRAAWKKIADDGPAGLESVCAYDKRRDRIVLWGVKNHENGGSGAETWEFDGARWEKRS